MESRKTPQIWDGWRRSKGGGGEDVGFDWNSDRSSYSAHRHQIKLYGFHGNILNVSTVTKVNNIINKVATG